MNSKRQILLDDIHEMQRRVMLIDKALEEEGYTADLEIRDALAALGHHLDYLAMDLDVHQLKEVI